MDKIDEIQTTITASEAKQNFGKLLFDAQHAPIQINKSGKPVAFVLSAAEYHNLSRLRLEKIREAITRGVEQCERGEMTDGDEALARVKQKIKIAKSG